MLIYKWKIWLYPGKTRPSINATVADFRDWESNLIIPARCRQKVPPRHLEKSYLYTTGTHFYSTSNNFKRKEHGRAVVLWV